MVNRPKMILFDYGQTLIYQDYYNSLKGYQAIYQYITSNPENITPEQMNELAKILYENCNIAFDKTSKHEWIIDIKNTDIQRYISDIYKLEYSKSLDEREIIYWDNACNGTAADYIVQFLDYLYKSGIKTGVVSNSSFSSGALLERLNRLIPNNHFEFVIASSDYIFRKPHPYIFQLAIVKSGFEPESIWYCGDDTVWDVEAAYKSGMFPIWYTANLDYEQRTPIVPHLEIKNWCEVIDVLQTLK